MTATIRIEHRSPRRSSGPAPSRPARRVCERRVVRPAVRGSVGRASATTSAATYRRRRVIVGTILAVVVAVGMVATHDVLAGSGGDPASAAVSQPAHAVSVVALPGDSLWSIADRYRGEISITRYVDTLVDLNGGASIEAGQLVVLP